MAPRNKTTIGDFGLPRRPVKRTQVVGIFDLVGFTDLDSNKELYHAVRILEDELTDRFDEHYYWDDRTKGLTESPINNLLLRSTGDGYVVAFSQGLDDINILQHLREVHAGIRAHFAVRLGINKGKNNVVKDLNERVNIIGWGINLAARALQFAEPNQIICTEYLVGPILETDGELAAAFQDVGQRTVKKTKVHLHNHFKRGEYGAPLSRSQKEKG